jgi:tetratricopeptide (TPR) repeat protein
MRRFFLVFLVFLPCMATAQLQGQHLIDSLLIALPKIGPDSLKIAVLDDLSYEYRNINPDEGIKYAKEELALTLLHDNRSSTAQAYVKLGVNYQSKGEYGKALEYFYDALGIFEETGETYFVGQNMSHIGAIYLSQGNYPKALEFYLKSLSINEKLNIKESIGGDLGNIGNIYMSMQNYPKALEYGLRSLKIFESFHDTGYIANNLGNIGNAYEGMGDHERALEYDQKALDFFEKMGDNMGISNTLNSLGSVYKGKGDLPRALDYTFRSLHLCEEIGDKGGVGINLGNIGEIYLEIVKDTTGKIIRGDKIPEGKTANLNMAIDYLKKGIAGCKESDLLSYTIGLCKELSEAYLLQGNYKAALEQYKEYTAAKDTVFSNETKMKISNLETERELDKKDKQIQIDRLEIAKKHWNKQLSNEKKRHLERIEAQTKVLTDIANIQSHEVGGQVATILGLVQLFNFDDLTDPTNKVVIEGVTEVTEKLDKIVKDTIRQENNLNRGQ